MSKKKKTCLILLVIATVIIIALVIGSIFLVKNLNNTLERLVDIEITDVDLEQIEDGTYNGQYDAFPVAVEVAVTVANHQIKKIEIIEHQQGKGKAAEVIIDDVMEAQSLEVDSISGATYSSRVILLAIQDALENA